MLSISLRMFYAENGFLYEMFWVSFLQNKWFHCTESEKNTAPLSQLVKKIHIESAGVSPVSSARVLTQIRDAFTTLRSFKVQLKPQTLLMSLQTENKPRPLLLKLVCHIFTHLRLLDSSFISNIIQTITHKLLYKELSVYCISKR